MQQRHLFVVFPSGSSSFRSGDSYYADYRDFYGDIRRLCSIGPRLPSFRCLCISGWMEELVPLMISSIATIPRVVLAVVVLSLESVVATHVNDNKIDIMG